MNKLRTNRGETLVETLISIIIVVISVAFLVTSITAATRINAKVKNAVSSQMAFRYADRDSATGNNGSMTAGGILTNPINVDIYESNGYYYYIKGSDANGQNN